MYIVIEAWPDPETASIVTDTNGINIVFDTIEEAELEADDCQNGMVIEIN